MLKSLNVKNLTVFADADLEFSPSVNVIVGENGTGKTHLLKAPYCVLATSAEGGRRSNGAAPTKAVLEPKISEKLVGVLRPESLGRLARRRMGQTRCEIQCRFRPSALDLDFEFATKSREVTIKKLPTAWLDKAPVYLPTRELLTIYPGFVSVYESHYLDFEETWRDTCLLLGAAPLRVAREARVREVLKPLEAAIEGRVELDKNGRFYLSNKQGRMEMALVAEGWRKLGMIAQLIATGSLLDKGYLFWDEPETNLNPKLIRKVARVILHLSGTGIQVFLATHSLFLMREFDILLKTDEFESIRARFIGLQRQAGGVVVEQGDTIDEIGVIAALDEELHQSDRYLEAGA
jgi:energy-coupling factor transporter ATP-binding protein EcfA2